MKKLPEEGADKHKVECRRGIRAEADFECFIVVRLDAENRNKAVDHQVDVVVHEGHSSRELLRRGEKQRLEIQKIFY